jgi:hypothetical protein
MERAARAQSVSRMRAHPPRSTIRWTSTPLAPQPATVLGRRVAVGVVARNRRHRVRLLFTGFRTGALVVLVSAVLVSAVLVSAVLVTAVLVLAVPVTAVLVPAALVTAVLVTAVLVMR